MTIDWGGLGTVLGVGLIAGVGLVALFAVGVRVLARQPAGTRPVPRIVTLAAACFLVCATAAGYGIYILVGSP